MANSPQTRPSLLIRIRSPEDRAAWLEFVDVYAPLVYAYGRKHGLQDADAADLTQDVLASVSAAVQRRQYDPQRGSFRGWLFTVVRNCLRKSLPRQERCGRGSGDTTANELLREYPAPAEDPEALWQEEYEQRVFDWAAEQVRPQVEEATWQAFWLTAVQGKSGKEVARTLGITVAAVYLAKSRVLARLKGKVHELQGE
jgi:RNA polymerase sigma-70 factor (ECF subfamily)